MSHLSMLKKKMENSHVGAFIVSSQIGQRYLTGFDYTDGYVIVTSGKSYVLTDFRYIEAAKAKIDTDEFEIIMPDCGMMSAAASLIAESGSDMLLFEEDDTPYSQFDRFRKEFTGIKFCSGGSRMLKRLRIVKDDKEIAKIKRAQEMTDAGFSHIIDFIRPDMTEREVALELEFFMRNLGSEGTAFDTIAVSGSNSSRPHGVPRDVKLERGFFTMDFGARFDGYDADMTRTVVLGKADDEMKRLYNTVLRAQTTAIDALYEGMKCRDADTIARNIINDAGYEGCFGHSLGHGVGMYIHEEPRFAQSTAEDVLLCRGNVVTVEPGIYIEGKYGCRIEDMIYVNKDGRIEDLTHSDKSLIELF